MSGETGVTATPLVAHHFKYAKEPASLMAGQLAEEGVQNGSLVTGRPVQVSLSCNLFL